MGFLSFLLKVFKIKPSWNGTPAMFLAFVLDMQKRNNPVFSVHEVLQWGEVMQKVAKVNLSPFRDFADLLQNGVPDYTLVEKKSGKLDELNHRQELKKALYGKNVDMGDDDVMTSNSEGAVFARKLVKDLSKYVEFPEDEKDELDRL